MTTEKMTVKITFNEPTLALNSENRETQETYIACKAPSQIKTREEIECLPNNAEEVKETPKTVFSRDDQNRIFVWNYQWRGFIKGALESLIELGESTISKWQYKKVVDLFVFVDPRRIFLLKPDGAHWLGTDPKIITRPLRATTMQGDRIALAASEMLPEGTTCQFVVESQVADNAKAKLALVDRELLEAIFNRGKFVGFSQWHGGGWGRFTWEEVK
jgi:hypothetical protein